MDQDRINRSYTEKEMVDIYTTIQGDTWDIISFKVYGDEKYMSDLLKSNPQHINTIFFSSGVEIICPDIDTEEVQNLPPWKR